MQMQKKKKKSSNEIVFHVKASRRQTRLFLREKVKKVNSQVGLIVVAQNKEKKSKQGRERKSRFGSSVGYENERPREKWVQ